MTKKVTFGLDFPENLKRDVSLSSTPKLSYDDIGDFIEERSKIRRLLDNVNETDLKVDYSDFANHVFFDSALSKYAAAQDRILTKYPYNGNREEKDAYFLTGSGYDNYLFEQWPRGVGYVKFSTSNQFISASDYNKKLVFGTSSFMISADVSASNGAPTPTSRLIVAIHSGNAGQFLGGIRMFLSGTSAVWQIASGAQNSAIVADYSAYSGSWHNIACLFDKPTGMLNGYVDGVLVASGSFPIYGPIEQNDIKVLIGGHFDLGYGIISGAIDNVRLYLTSSELLLRKNLSKPIDSEDYVALNYTFNEGITATSSIDMNVVDYSKNAVHGVFGGYTTTTDTRISGTSFYSDPGDPILYSFHGSVVAFSGTNILSASLYDATNNNQIFNLIPEGVLIADEAQEGLMISFSLALARFFDEMKLYVDQFDNLRITNYDDIDETPDQFLPMLTRYFGWKVTEHFSDTDPLSFFFGEGVKTNKNLEVSLVEIRNQFWRRILNNLPYLLKTKGKRYNVDAFFNVIGLNKENVNLKEYGYLAEGTIADTRLHREKASPFLGIGTGSLSSSFIKVPSLISASNNAYTVETFMQLPYQSSSYSASLSVLTGAIWQFVDATQVTGSFSLLWNVNSLGNTFGKFILTGSNGQIFSSSAVEVFDGDFVYIAAGLKSNQIPFIEIRTLDNDAIDFSASYTGSVALSGVFTGSNYDFIMGASSGTFFQKATQGYYGQYRFWNRPLSASEITDHALNFESIGTYNPIEIPNPLLGYWPLTENMSSSAGGILSGVQDLSRNNRIGTGSNFPVSYNPYKKFLTEYNYLSPSFDLRWTENKIRIHDKTELTIDDVAKDTNEVSLEFNLVDALNRDISKIFSTFTIINNAIGNPVNKYRDEYADLEAYARLYFDRLGDSVHFNKFFDLFRWFDKKISDAIKQLLPARVKFIGGEQVIESHALERPRYKYKYPIFRTPVDIPNAELSGVVKFTGDAMGSFVENKAAMGTTSRTSYESQRLNALNSGKLLIPPREQSVVAEGFYPFAKKSLISRFGGGNANPAAGGKNIIVSSFKTLLFSSSLSTSVLKSLPTTISVNGQFVAPDFVYIGNDATTTTWPPATGSVTLALTSSGNALSASQDTLLLNSIDKSVRFSGGQYFSTNGVSSVGDITTEDFCLEALFSLPEDNPGSNSQNIVSKYDVLNSKGWFFNMGSGVVANSKLTFFLTSIGVGSAATYSTSSFPRAWVHVMVFGDRSETSANGFRMFVNGDPCSLSDVIGTDISSNSPSLSNSRNLAIGGHNYVGTGPWHGNIAMVSLWKKASWFAGGSSNNPEWVNIARDRFAKVSGVYPFFSTSAGIIDNSSSLFVSSSRDNSPAYITKYNNATASLYLAGPNWPRLSQKIDVSGNFIAGYFPENLSINILSSSGELSGAWGGELPSFVSASYFGTPTYSLIGRNAGFVSQSIKLTSTFGAAASGIPRVFSVYARAADPNSPFIYLSPTNNSNTAVWFNLHSGTITTTSGVQAPDLQGRIENLGNRWWRCSVSTTASLLMCPLIGLSTGSGNPLTVINNVTGAIITGIQYETGSYEPTSYVSYVVFSASGRTMISGSPTRSDDSLIYSGTFLVSASLQSTFLINNNVRVGGAGIVQLSDGTTTNRLGFYGTSGEFGAIVIVSGNLTEYNPFFLFANQGIDNGDRHTIRLGYSSASHRLAFDGTDVAISTTGNVPPFFNQLSVGKIDSATTPYLTNGLIESVQIEKNTNDLTFFPVKISGDTSTDGFGANSDINSRNEFSKVLLQSADQSNKNDFGNIFVKTDVDSSKNQEHYFGGNKKHFDLKLAFLSGNLSASVTLAGANQIELSSTLMDLNNVLIMPANANAASSCSFDTQIVFGNNFQGAHDLIGAKFKFSVSASNTAFAVSDIGVEFRDFQSTTAWTTYTHIETLGVYQSSSKFPGWLDYEYNFSRNGKISLPAPAYQSFTPYVRLSSSTGKTYVFRDVRIEFTERLTDAGVSFYKTIDNDNNKDNFTYLNESVLKDIEN